MQITWRVWASKDRWETQAHASRIIYSREEAIRQAKAIRAYANVSVSVEEYYADVPARIIWQANP